MKSHISNLVTDLIILVVNMVLSLKFPYRGWTAPPPLRSELGGEGGGAGDAFM